MRLRKWNEPKCGHHAFGDICIPCRARADRAVVHAAVRGGPSAICGAQGALYGVYDHSEATCPKCIEAAKSAKAA